MQSSKSMASIQRRRIGWSEQERLPSCLIRTPSCGEFSRNPHEGVRIKRLPDFFLGRCLSLMPMVMETAPTSERFLPGYFVNKQHHGHTAGARGCVDKFVGAGLGHNTAQR